MTDYLTVAEVLAMHADQIERYGGSHGVRDPGLLEAALFRPQTGYYADLIEEAVALWERAACAPYLWNIYVELMQPKLVFGSVTW